MAANYTLALDTDSDGLTIQSRNPTWCVAIIRFTRPAAINTKEGDKAELLQTKMSIIQNDCVGMTVSRPKSGFAKMATIQLKSTDIWWSNVISPGDWVACWAHNFPEETDKVITALNKVKNGGSGGADLNGWDSGLKFVGRVLTVNQSDSVTSNGIRTPIHTISAQAFLELSTSVYYNYLAGIVTNPALSTPSGSQAASVNDQQRTDLINNAAQWQALKSSMENRAGGQVADFAAKFLQLYEGKTEWSPDNMIHIMFQLTMGIQREANAVNQFGLNGSPNNAIMVPPQVASIFGRPGKRNLWQMYNVLLGIQKYSGNGQPWERMFPNAVPDADKSKPKEVVFWTSGTRCQGFVPFYPPQWDNRAIWSLLAGYLNDVVNEMYTCLRINKYNQILPTLVVREKPFSTGLVNYMSTIPTNIENPELKKLGAVARPGVSDQEIAEMQARTPAKTKGFTIPIATGKELQQRTMFAEVPRWVIDESYILSVDTACSEAARINFVQVWGRSSGAEFAGVRGEIAGPEALKQAQALAGNWVCDKNDVTRNGLRSDIVESPFDVLPNKGNTLAPVWAKKRADWMFNGHLKPAGTITLIGVKEPICEGDNCEVRGVCYHIDAVVFNCSLSPTGHKVFTTVLTVSNGLAVKGLASTKNPPIYPIQLPYDNAFGRDVIRTGNDQGYSEVQTGANRNSDGEPIGDSDV